LRIKKDVAGLATNVLRSFQDSRKLGHLVQNWRQTSTHTPTHTNKHGKTNNTHNISTAWRSTV